MNRGMRMVVGALEAQDKTGLRVSVTGGEALAMLFEISSGKLLALMGYPFSNLRISATVGLAIERFTDAAARTVAMIGSGRLALSALEPAAALRPIDRILVYSRSADKREAFARKASEKLKIPVQAVTAPEQAIDAADFVLVSTNSPAAALRGQWLRPGLSIFGIGRPNEFDDDVYLRAESDHGDEQDARARVLRHQTGSAADSLDRRLARSPGTRWPSWAIFSRGQIAVPHAAHSIIVFRDSQGGYGDLALAGWAYEEARRRGLGRRSALSERVLSRTED